MLVLFFNIIKGSLVAPESSWPYAPSHTFLMLHDPESFQNNPNHLGIIVESRLNHLVQDAKQGAALNPKLPLRSAALKARGFCSDAEPRTRHALWQQPRRPPAQWRHVGN